MNNWPSNRAAMLQGVGVERIDWWLGDGISKEWAGDILVSDRCWAGQKSYLFLEIIVEADNYTLWSYMSQGHSKH